MAFALTKFVSYGYDIAGPSKKRGIQRATLTISATTADVDLDIGDDSGTFWTAAAADSTYGALASKALEVLQKIEDNALAFHRIDSEQLLDRIQAAAASGTAYVLAVQNKRPNLTFDAANGETSWVIDLEWLLNDGIYPIVSSFG